MAYRQKQEEFMTRSINKRAILSAAALLMVAPGVALAQNDVADKANEVAEQAQQVEQQADELANTQSTDTQYVARDDDDDFPWGLLGLLGLAGLLGLKKRRDGEIHVDARRDTRP
jgi:MYXO-CTERM domain-containing protein